MNGVQICPNGKMDGQCPDFVSHTAICSYSARLFHQLTRPRTHTHTHTCTCCLEWTWLIYEDHQDSDEFHVWAVHSLQQNTDRLLLQAYRPTACAKHLPKARAVLRYATMPSQLLGRSSSATMPQCHRSSAVHLFACAASSFRPSAAALLLAPDEDQPGNDMQQSAGWN